MPLQATSGAASYDAFGGGVPIVPNYIEEVFSTYLYTGTGATQTITNEIDLAGKGGLVWTKIRNIAQGHPLTDTVRGSNKISFSNLAGTQFTQSDTITSFNSTGYTLGADSGNFGFNATVNPHVSWTFRKQPKFFDVVTYTGTGSNQTIAHSLGSVPGSIFVKRTNAIGAWQVYHRSLANTEYLVLNDTAAKATGATRWNSTTPTSTVFSIGTDATVNASGGTYVAYIFAHDAGGFGLTGSDNVISCGSYTGIASADGPSVTLGYEPQWLMVKCSSDPYSWVILDNMRGLDQTGSPRLFPNTTDAESAMSPGVVPTATGFKINTTNATVNDGAGVTYIYIAIRRGPMKVPTSGTSVFSPITNSASTGTVNTTGFPVDMGIVRWRDGTDSNFLRSRLQGVSSTTTESGAWLKTNATDAESTAGGLTRLWDNTGFQTTSGFSGYSTVYWNFGRAPSFFDEVCYTGTGSSTTFSHNLAAVPELIIFKRRSAANPWMVYCNRYNGGVNANQYYQVLNATDSENSGSGLLNNTNPTSSVFTVGTWNENNASGSTYVAYLFATCAGVSKVGAYTGTATTKQIDCGFTGGARFVLIKKTSGTGSWYVWDSARGIVSGNDPYLLLNSTAAEVTNTDYIDTYSAGFEISSTAPSEINENGGSFIFLAIA